MADGVYDFDPDTGVERPLALLDLPRNHRLNDGKRDPEDRLWVGTINTAENPSATAALYAFRNERLEEVEGGYENANGKVWSPDGRIMYHADTARNTIWQYEYDIETGSASRKRVFVRTGELSPDGLCLDGDGNIIAAMFGGSCLQVYSPRGDLIVRIDLPIPNPTSCAISGDTLFVTTAFDGLDDEQRRTIPLSGQVLFVKPYGDCPARRWIAESQMRGRR